MRGQNAKTAGLLLVLLGMPGEVAATEPLREADRPHMVVILVDDLRYDTFGFMQHPFIETPHLDRLAAEGVHFAQACVTTSLCSPARASFLTGQYMHRHRVVDNNSPMPADTLIFPQLLQQAGYVTAFIGKWHMGGSSDAPRPGFDHWVSFRGQGTYDPQGAALNVDGQQVPRTKYMTDELTDYAEAWLRARDGQQPFMLYLSHKGVHGLYEPAPRHHGRYAGVSVVPPGTMRPAPEEAEKPMWVHDQRNSWHGVEFPYHGRSGQSLAEMYRHYCEMILSIDESVGRLREVLHDLGIAERTLLVFTSDGGHLWGEHGLIDKRCAYEPSMRIPFLTAGPGVAAGARCDALVTNLDLAPTLLERAGVQRPAALQGESFAKLLSEPNAAWHRDAVLYEYYWEHNFPQTPTTFALRTPRYKLIQYHGIWDTDELYDLQLDPAETTNLIRRPEQQQRVAALREQLQRMLADTGGMQIPLGTRRGAGALLRDSAGSSRADFPYYMRQSR